MNVVQVEERDIKSSTIFLRDQQIVFHPRISPDGKPDFTNYLGRQYLLILDRNIFTKIIELCSSGSLKDTHILKLIGSLMFWVLFNNIGVTAGLALSEYANGKNNNIDANRENCIFDAIFDYYDPKMWLELAVRNRTQIPIIEVDTRFEDYDFNIKLDHYKMHYAEMLYATFLCFQKGLSAEKKMTNFLEWNKENLLFCQYTIVYVMLLFSNRITPPNLLSETFQNLADRCSNQAWDITYLSAWSTFYWDEDSGNISYLFSTMDKGLKKVFTSTHDAVKNPFTTSFGKHKGPIVQQRCEQIMSSRIKPVMSREAIDDLVKREELRLRSVVRD